MTIARYSFLPWLRRGIANQIRVAATGSRATVPVDVVAASDAAQAAVPTKHVQLIGPGDVVGFIREMVIRTEPRHLAMDFEPNYLAFVEFYDEDFLWRYTPDTVDGGAHRLPPWLTLAVLEQGEFELTRQPGRPLRSFRLATGVDPKNVFPPHASSQTWPWAHVHLNESVGTGHTPNHAVLESTLRRNPDAGFCRLLCPRRLHANRAYHAFVIPSYAVGRKAGIGLPIADADPATEIAWKTAAELPIYYEWTFQTGDAGDFEELVRALKPRTIPKEVGIRDLDIQRPGFGMPAIVSAPDDVVGLEGALLSPFSEPKPLDGASNFPAEIEERVNLAAETAKTGPPGGDPVVTVPLYGRWHALVDRIDPSPAKRNWVNELNVDPRFRAPAGMGTLVIQKNQESYMKLAWQQIGEVLAANRKVHFLQMALRANEAAFAKHLVPLTDARALPLVSPVFRKIMGSPVTVHYLVRESRVTHAAFSGALRKQLRPRGLLARRLGAVHAPGGIIGEVVTQLNDGAISAAPPRPAPAPSTLESAIENAAPRNAASGLTRFAELLAFLLMLIAVLVILIAPAVWTVLVALGIAAAAILTYRRLRALRAVQEAAQAISPQNLTVAAAADLPQNSSFALAPGGENPPDGSTSMGPDSPDARDFRTAVADFHAILEARVPPPPPRSPIAIEAVHDTVMHAIEPARAFPRRASPFLRIGDTSVVAYASEYADTPPDAPVERLVPAMAYPDIKNPMYEPLRDISSDLFVPNLDLIPRNTISLMVQNQPFIEAYMVGLNHEFGRELLWREYPTDQRPSTFRQFWDASNYVDREGATGKVLAEKIRDITRIHEWARASHLGEHNNRDPEKRLRFRDVDPLKRAVVLVIRGDLLKRYPNTIVYAQHARWGEQADTLLKLVLWDETGEKTEANSKDLNLRFPLYKAKVEPDIHFVGFDLTLGEVRGDPTLDETADAKARLAFDQLGWFFVIKEVVGEPRFGLDERATTNPSSNKWDNLSWEHVDPSAAVIDVAKPFVMSLPGANPDAIGWGTNAADMAHILYQKPVLVAVHARDMLKQVERQNSDA